MAENLITAITLRRGVVEWTTLRQKKNAIEVVEQREEALELPTNVVDLNAPEVSSQVRAKCGLIKGTVCVTLPSDQALMRVATLPSKDVAELRSMAELQVDKFSPFPIENMSIAVEALSQDENSTRVLIVAVLREHVTKLGDAYRKAGLTPRQVDVEALGWWKLLQDHGDVPKQGRNVIMVIDENCTELVITEEGVPIIFRSLGSQKQLTAAESASEIVDEIQYTLTTIESEWGAKTPGSLLVWHYDAAPEQFMELLKQGCSFPVESRHLESLPPLSEGVARRSADRNDQMVNLAPPEWGSSLEQKQVRKILLRTVAIFFGVWLLGVIIFLVGYKIQQSRLARIKADLAALAAPSTEVQQLKEEISSLKRYADRRYSGLECLRDVSARLPPGVDLTSFSYKKYGQVNIRGEADASDPIYEFFKQLEESDLYAEVKPEGVTTQVRQGKQRSQFRVTAVLPGEKS